jgi:DNA-binding CsgD family transcriptional regulator
MLIKQQTLLAEKLEKEQEIIVHRNRELEEELAQIRKKTAAKSLNVISLGENLKLLHQKLIELVSTDSFQNKSKLDRIVKDLEKDLLKIDSKSDFNENFNVVFNDFQKLIADAYPRLTHKDVKICLYIRMGKSNIEIASLLNISPTSLEISRYRIRKKMKISKGVNLNDFIIRL